MKKLFFTAAALLCLLVSISAFAQSTAGTIGGTAADASGAVIPGVTVTATNTQTGIVTTVLTNETGVYQFANLQSGQYKLEATLPGFKAQVYNNVDLISVGQLRLNFTLQVGAPSQSVEVSVAADTLIAATQSSVSTVLSEYKVNDLPLINRNVLDLVASTTANVSGSNIAGAGTAFAMTTRDGLPVNNGRYANGIYSVTYVSPDLVDQVRVVVSPADAETGRGSGQVQMTTRSGTNKFNGSLFWTDRNAVLDANTSSNNNNGLPVNYLNRNQFGGRLGGPIKENKTFFFFLYEGMRTVQRQTVTSTVLTDLARQGKFRFFPGNINGNATANVTSTSAPVVDLTGNPIVPANGKATGPMVTLDLFSRDPLRPGMDPSGLVAKQLSLMPSPNNFKTGDGLNTAGYQFVRRTIGNESFTGTGNNINRNQINIRLDHNFNTRHKATFSMSREHDWAYDALPAFSTGFAGQVIRRPQVYTVTFVSTLSPSILNEARFGLRTGPVDDLQAYDVPGQEDKVKQYMLTKNGILARPLFSTIGTGNGGNMAFNDSNGSIGNTSPLWTYGDNLSFNKGKHAFKAGAEFRYGHSNAWNSDEIIPGIQFGRPGSGANGRQAPYFCSNCGIAVQNLETNTVSGLQSADASRAQDILADLAGSVMAISEAFSLRPDPKNIVFEDYTKVYQKYRDIHQNEWTAFFKDDWKVRRNLTLNLGVRWEWFGIVYEGSGLTAAPAGGGNGLFGITGSSFADWYKPGVRGTVTTPEFVGKHSPQPGKKLYPNDWNNFSPNIGFSYAIPWLGEQKTVIRGGYGIAYQGLAAGGQGLSLDTAVGSFPGINQFARHPTTVNAEMLLSNLVLPIPERLPSGALPVISLPDSGQQSITAFDNHLVTPYVQNFNLSIQRQLKDNLTLEVGWIASKGSRLTGTINLNSRIVEENGILNAFKITEQGGNAPLFDQILNGITFTGIGAVNGTSLTGSSALRRFTTTRTFLATGNVQSLANFFNTDASLTGTFGGILKKAGLPPNFIVANPQFGAVSLYGNPNNSIYDALNVSLTKRLSKGFTNTTTWTWSKSFNTGGAVDTRSRSTRTWGGSPLDVRSNGTWDLPFGPSRMLLGNAPGWVNRLVEHWQLGAIFNWNSGPLVTFTGGNNAFGGASYVNLVGDLPKDYGKLTPTTKSGTYTYFPDWTQVTDPYKANVTTVDNLQTSNNNLAIQDSKGNLIMVNAPTGTIGNMGPSWIRARKTVNLDLDLIKRIKVSESKSFELRVDAINVLNHPNYGAPNAGINSTSFGQITLPTTGNRQFTFNARLNF